MKKNTYLFHILRLFYGLYKKYNRHIYRKGLKGSGDILNIDNIKKHSFCGYYDHSPFCVLDEELILVNSTDSSILRKPNPREKLYLYIVNWKKNKIEEKVGSTYAWNWQQGCRALWVSPKKYVYNFYNVTKDFYQSKLGTLGCSNQIDLDFPVQEVSSLGFAYSLDYKILTKLRPDYGYFCHNADDINLTNNSIIELDLQNLIQKSIVTSEELASDVRKRHKSDPSLYKINHIHASPSGKKIIYMFRYYINNIRVTDVYLFNKQNNSNIILLPDLNASHYCWMDDENLLFTGIYHGEFGYFLVNIVNFSINKILVSIDGHPVPITPTRFLSDSYANKYGIRSLWAYDISNSTKTNILASFIEPFYLWGQRRCDLHPSISKSKKFWQVDCVSNNVRKICIGSMNDLNF